VNCQPGATMGLPAIRFEGEQVFLCEEGELEVQLDGEQHVLRAGDTLHFKAELPHHWSNKSDAPARFLVIGTLLPNMRRTAGGDDGAH